MKEGEENIKDNTLNSEEKRGLNESETYEDAKNDYQNGGEGVEGIAGVPNTNAAADAATGEAHPELDTPGTHSQDTPGSSGAFPVGAFDISKD
jgi:hypothetical protein